MDVAAAVAGLLSGLAVGPLADRLASNAPAGRPLLATTPRSRRLPLVVAGTVVLGAAAGAVFGFTLEAAIAALFCWILVIVTRTDLERRLIPNRIVVPATVLVLALRTIDDPSLEWLLSGATAGAFLLVAALVHPRGMGMGDVKLAAFLGAGLGTSVALALFAGFVAAAIPAVVLIARHGLAARKLPLPLGPFLALGAVLALYAGEPILDWYLRGA